MALVIQLCFDMARSAVDRIEHLKNVQQRVEIVIYENAVKRYNYDNRIITHMKTQSVSYCITLCTKIFIYITVRK